jgi:hypothetical protein
MVASFAGVIVANAAPPVLVEVPVMVLVPLELMVGVALTLMFGVALTLMTCDGLVEVNCDRDDELSEARRPLPAVEGKSTMTAVPLLITCVLLVNTLIEFEPVELMVLTPDELIGRRCR